MSDTKLLWTPDGVKTLGLGGKPRERVELRAGVMEWLRQFADVASHLKLGVHCSLCQSDLVGKNSDAAKIYVVTCGCREFIGPNRDYRAPTTKERVS